MEDHLKDRIRTDRVPSWASRIIITPMITMKFTEHFYYVPDVVLYNLT